MNEQRADGGALRAALAAVLAGAVLAGCGGAASSGTTARTPPATAPTGAAENAAPTDGGRDTGPTGGTDAAGAPAAGAPLPKDAAGLAADLTTTTGALRAAIDAWDHEGRPPEAVVLLALRQQRIVRHLARKPALADRTYPRLAAPLARQTRDDVTAARDLLSLVRPLKGGAKFRVREPEPAAALLRHFKRAERRFGVSWQVLAAVMFVETKFGRVRSPSHTGAKGPMQFMPGTWAAYGMGGDVHDTGDSILAAANYLHASGAPRDYRRALFAYNHSQRYVNAVLLHAGQMKRDVRSFYRYHSWQVYVVTTDGDRRLTGPGL
ncbi:lytic transglycosylase domain-containing protein [Spongiactinospora gelatinilytica]|nr:lytic transglycosylase domain-containing protein [Spongiactinospora gelatinilytica]